MKVAHPSQTLFFQLYKHRNDEIAEERIREVERLGYKAIFLTVDAIVAGKRETDIRSPWVLEEQENGPVYFEHDSNHHEVDTLGTAGALVANDDRDMTWQKVNFDLILYLPKAYTAVDDSLVAESYKTACSCERSVDTLFFMHRTDFLSSQAFNVSRYVRYCLTNKMRPSLLRMLSSLLTLGLMGFYYRIMEVRLHSC